MVAGNADVAQQPRVEPCKCAALACPLARLLQPPGNVKQQGDARFDEGGDRHDERRYAPEGRDVTLVHHGREHGAGDGRCHAETLRPWPNHRCLAGPVRTRYHGPMTASPFIAEVGALMGDPARANMLTALMDGRAWTASELAFMARVSPQTASGHLAKLTAGGMLQVAKQGRHRYYTLAGPLVAQLLEAAGTVAVNGPPRHRPRTRIDDALRRARTCYDHLAGQLGVAFADALVARGMLLLEDEGGEVTEKGVKALGQFGIDVVAEGRRKRIFCRPCLDWSERRPHVAGAIGSAIAGRCFELGWISRIRDSRAVHITDDGARGLAETFGIELPADVAP